MYVYICFYSEINIQSRYCNIKHNSRAELAGQWPTQKPYKNCFLFQKECSQLYDFCREADKVGQTHCVCIIHPRSVIFGTHNPIIPIINNIKKFFD